MNSTFGNLVIVHITPQRLLKASQQDENEYCGTLVSLQRLPSVYIGTLYLNSVKGKLKQPEEHLIGHEDLQQFIICTFVFVNQL